MVLFRGQIKETKEFVYWNQRGYLCTSSGKEKEQAFVRGAATVYKRTITEIYSWLDRDTIGMYSTYNDSMNRKMFEGDIVRKVVSKELSVVQDSNGFISILGVITFGKFTVKKNDVYTGFFIDWLAPKQLGCALSIIEPSIAFWKDNGPIEIVGNIYDNKEVLDYKI